MTTITRTIGATLLAPAVVLAVALPASASISGKDAAALSPGATRYAVQQAAGTGCHVDDSRSGGTEHLRKLYKIEGGSLWLVVSYAKPSGQAHFHLDGKAIGNDLQLLGARCSGRTVPSVTGCSVIEQTQVVTVARPPVNVVDETQVRYKTSCLEGAATYTPWITVSSAPHRP